MFLEARMLLARFRSMPGFSCVSSVPGADVNALLDVGAAATAADLQRELNPSGVALNPPPIYQVSKIEAGKVCDFSKPPLSDFVGIGLFGLFVSL